MLLHKKNREESHFNFKWIKLPLLSAYRIASILPTKTNHKPYYQPTVPSWYNSTWHDGGKAFSWCSRIHHDKNGWIAGFANLVHAGGTQTILCLRHNWQRSPPPTWGLDRIMFCVGNETDFSNGTNITPGMTTHVHTTRTFTLLRTTVFQHLERRDECLNRKVKL